MHFDTFNIDSSVGLQLLTRLRLGLSHLNEHKFKHNFREPETRFHCLLQCHLFQIERRTLVNDIKEKTKHITTDHKNYLDQMGMNAGVNDANKMNLMSTINFCTDSKKFDFSLF